MAHTLKLSPQNKFAMLKNYLIIAFRNLFRNKTFSFINLFGLTTGTACCIYILLFVQEHRGYDRHHQDSDQIFRIITDLDLAKDGEIMHMATCSPPIPLAIQADFPEVAVAARVCSPPGSGQHQLRVGDQVFFEAPGVYADSTLFQVLDYQFLTGDAKHALDEPYSVVISEKLSRKLFNTSEALGQTIGIGGGGAEHSFKVTGVFNEGMGKSHLMPNFIMTMNSGGIGEYIRSNTSWAGNNFIYGYLRLKPGADALALESKLPDFLQKHGADQLKQLGMGKELFLQPVTDIHTNTDRFADQPDNTSRSFLNILLLIAGFIQLVACINFMNLTTARSTRRAQEVGVRKAIGAPRAALVGQFLGESLFLTVIAMVLAFPLIEFALPFVNNLTGADLTINFSENWGNVGMIAVLLLVTGLVAGSYPAFYLSSFKPLDVLRGSGKSKGGEGAIWLRKGLVVSQFAISSALVIGALVIHFQLDYLLGKELGFEKAQKIVIPFHSDESKAKLETYRHALLQLPEVKNASAIDVCPGATIINDIPLYKEGGDMNSSTDILHTYVDEHFFETLKINLLSGRNFIPSDTSSVRGEMSVILNETAIKDLGIPVEEAPGQVLYSDFEDMHFKTTIVGVMEDVHYQSLDDELRPFMVVAEPARNLSNLVADVRADDYPAFFEKAKTLWGDFLPTMPFDFSFLDENIARQYQTEQTLSHIISAFTLMAILISCLGLFGLSAFAAEQRQKEVGIRKVLGATTVGIVGLLSKDFLKLVIVSLVIAAPISWYFMDKWLADFANRISIEWYVFAIAGLAAILIAGLTVSFQSIRAALANPVESLRSE